MGAPFYVACRVGREKRFMASHPCRRTGKNGAPFVMSRDIETYETGIKQLV